MYFRTIESFNITECLFIAFLTFLFYYFRFYYNYFTRPSPLPGPLPLPFELENFFFDGDFKRLTANLHRKYGDICEFRLGGYRRIVISKTDYFENLLSSSKNLALFAKFEHTPAMDISGKFGRGMFLNCDYENWKINKYFLLQSISTPGFNEDAIKNTNELFEELSGYWNSLKKSHSFLIIGERGCSMSSYYNTFNTDKFKLGSSHFDDPKSYNSDKFSRALIVYNRGLMFFNIVHPFLRRYVPYFKNKADTILKSGDYIFGTMDNMIERRKIDFANNPQKLKSKHDLLSILITANNGAKGKMIESLTDEDIRALLLDIFLAGSDTSSNTLCYTIYYICQNPHVKQKMLDEIDSVFPINSSDTLHITTDHIAKLKYCEAIIKEASRMTPVVPVSRRFASAECEVAGYKFQAKTVFHLNYSSIHMNEKYWNNPTVFDPDRFYLHDNLGEFNDNLSDSDKENKKSIHDKDKFSLVIFGGGIRLCPGRKLAMITMLSFMVLLFKKYDVELVDMDAPLKTHTGFLTNCLELKIKIKPRKPSS
ncbi:cytochrome P450 [Gigaspora margarita]|uniref:Cytochrome P450 n=1 Tax=Gigaspora margarita TaxID=4874 RepID=A0A8H3XER7_GIGMA|nr:cytochrome P450 [Gigaspora margarita]